MCSHLIQSFIDPSVVTAAHYCLENRQGEKKVKVIIINEDQMHTDLSQQDSNRNMSAVKLKTSIFAPCGFELLIIDRRQNTKYFDLNRSFGRPSQTGGVDLRLDLIHKRRKHIFSPRRRKVFNFSSDTHHLLPNTWQPRGESQSSRVARLSALRRGWDGRRPPADVLSSSRSQSSRRGPLCICSSGFLFQCF